MLNSIKSTWYDLRSMNYRQLTLQLVDLGLVVTSALTMIWKCLTLFTEATPL